jgi:hypothetical protein
MQVVVESMLWSYSSDLVMMYVLNVAPIFVKNSGYKTYAWSIPRSIGWFFKHKNRAE